VKESLNLGLFPCDANFIFSSFINQIGKMIESELSQIVIGEAMYVHKVLGPGLLESVYKRCLFHRLQKIGLKVAWETPVPVVFEE
jgi:hypothetical protein